MHLKLKFTESLIIFFSRLLFLLLPCTFLDRSARREGTQFNVTKILEAVSSSATKVCALKARINLLTGVSGVLKY